MKTTIESAYGTVLSNALKMVAPIKNSIIKTECEVHIFIQKQALNILKINGYTNEYNFFMKYIYNINEGLVWADQDFKSYYHFYNPKEQRGKFGYEENAMTLSADYYNKSLEYLKLGNCEKSMFYLGAACHIVQDLTIPQHAKGRLLDNHRNFELYVRANYKNNSKFRTEEKVIYFNKIEDYIDYNSRIAIKLDYMYKNINNLTTKFYLTAIKAITLSQRTTAGCLIMFYNQMLLNYKNN